MYPGGLVALGVVPPGKSLGLCFKMGGGEVWNVCVEEAMVGRALEGGQGISMVLQGHFIGMHDIFVSAPMIKVRR